jgi:putative protease
MADNFSIPELLAPAGDWDCVRAAVANGADAIYFGLDRFNARLRAENFTVEELPELMEFLHARNVRGYVTFNTLLFPSELEAAAEYVTHLADAGVDAAIVQDIGLCRLIKAISPSLPIHASTQMTVSSAAGVRFAKTLGAELVVLARECSVNEISKIRHDLGADAVPLEVFVHGALCVAYSGQCLTSETLGGRSANRGECAQACRLPYELESDGSKVDLGTRRYLLSPQDLSGIDVIPELSAAGVSSLKIEGRLKSPEYVASVTRRYREALDRLKSGSPSQMAGREAKYELEMTFSRGLSTGWLKGIDNQRLVHAQYSSKRGVLIGKILRVTPSGIVLRTSLPLNCGDGVVFVEAGSDPEQAQGGSIYEMHPVKDGVELRFGRGVNNDKLRPGMEVWKTSDPQLSKALRQSYSRDVVQNTVALSFVAFGAAGSPLRLEAHSSEGHTAELQSNMPLEEARTQPLTAEVLKGQLSRLGGSPFHLEEVRNEIAGDCCLPLRELNRLRRELVEQLAQQRTSASILAVNSDGLDVSLDWAKRVLAQTTLHPAADVAVVQGQPTPKLAVLVRTLEQLEVALEQGVSLVYCDAEEIKRSKEFVKLARSVAGTEIFCAGPRVFKTGEDWILKHMRTAEPDGFLVRKFDQLHYFSSQRCVADFSLNIANQLSAAQLLSRYPVERMTPSHDLNSSQLTDLLKAAGGSRFELVIHTHMPMFHMEHCVFCAFLSDGTDYTNCGRPCDKHKVNLRDRSGIAHPLVADSGCRNTLFRAEAQSAVRYVKDWRALGARTFRVELLRQNVEDTRRLLDIYRKFLRDELDSTSAIDRLGVIQQVGVTEGQLPYDGVVRLKSRKRTASQELRSV